MQSRGFSGADCFENTSQQKWFPAYLRISSAGNIVYQHGSDIRIWADKIKIKINLFFHRKIL